MLLTLPGGALWAFPYNIPDFCLYYPGGLVTLDNPVKSRCHLGLPVFSLQSFNPLPWDATHSSPGTYLLLGLRQIAQMG